MDVMIPLGKGSNWQDNELRYCLRSLEKYFLDLNDVYIVGRTPDWVKNVFFIESDDCYGSNKGANIISKIHLCNNDNEEILFISDDQCFLKPMKADDIHPYYIYDLKKKIPNGGNRIWRRCLHNVKHALISKRLPCYNFETHTPKIINKKEFVRLMDNFDWRETHFPTHSLYFNNVVEYPEQMPENYRAFINYENANLDIIEGKSFLAYADIGLSWQLQHKLAELFPNKSRFEI